MRILQSKVSEPQKPRLILKGQFDPKAEYLVGDIVVYDNGVYALHTEGQTEPTADNWRLLTKAENGKDGQDGVSIKGEDGRSVEVQRDNNYIQWRHENGEWNNLFSLSELKGKDGRDGIDGKDGQAIVGDKGPKGDKGDKGDDGKSINWRGIFSLNVKYRKLDAVEYSGSSYIATDSVSGRTPDKSNRWNLMAKKGKDGEGIGYFTHTGGGSSTPSGGSGGAVDSVNGRTGVVTGLAEQSDLNTHTSNTSNPHSVTKAQVGLSNVDNTSDANKPISTATQTALNAKAIDADVVHDTGAETIAGVKTFSSDPIIPDEAYDATNWNGSLEPPTKNAVRDKIETMGGGVSIGGTVTSGVDDAILFVNPAGVLDQDASGAFTFDKVNARMRIGMRYPYGGIPAFTAGLTIDSPSADVTKPALEMRDDAAGTKLKIVNLYGQWQIIPDDLVCTVKSVYDSGKLFLDYTGLNFFNNLGTTQIFHVDHTGLYGVGINVGGTVAAGAKLELGGTNGALLLNRVTTAQKNAISSPQGGMLVYDTTLSKLGLYTSAWKEVMLVPTSPSAYTPTNVTTDRTFDANATTLDEIADTLGTLIADLQAQGLIG